MLRLVGRKEILDAKGLAWKMGEFGSGFVKLFKLLYLLVGVGFGAALAHKSTNCLIDINVITLLLMKDHLRATQTYTHCSQFYRKSVITIVSIQTISYNLIRADIIMSISSILLALCLLFCAIAIDTARDKEDYLKQLLKQYQNMQRLLSDISNIDANLNINVALVSNQTSELRLRIAALEDQQKLVLQTLQNTFLPNTIKTWACPAIPEHQYLASLKLQSQILIQSEGSIKTISAQPYCFRNEQMKQENLFLNTIAKGLRQELVDKCLGSAHLTLNVPFLDTSIARNYPNLLTQSPWLYGKITQNQFKDKVQQLISLYGAIACPLDTPFLSVQNKCIKCSSDGEAYDISLKMCKKCDSGCLINGGFFNSNPLGTNYLGTPPSKILGVPSCTKNEPFFNKKQCISCNLPLYFNFNANRCEACPQDQGYDQLTKTCKSNVFYVNSNGHGQNFIGNHISPPLYSTLKTCPQSAPFTNGKQCLSCISPFFYNFNTGQCQSCPAGIFDITTRSCSGGKGTKVNSNLLGSRNFVGKVPLYQSLFGICPANKRFFNGIECIQCLIPQYFNFQSLRCQPCPTKMTFDTVLQACQSQNHNFYTNILSQNIYYNGNFDEVVAAMQSRKAKGLRQCDANQPFFDSKQDKCIQCPTSTPLFDIKRSLCINCPKGSKYVQSTRICISEQVQAKIQRMIMNSR